MAERVGSTYASDTDFPWKRYMAPVENAVIGAIDFDHNKAVTNLRLAKADSISEKLKSVDAPVIKSLDFDTIKAQVSLEITTERKRRNAILSIVDMTVEQAPTEMELAWQNFSNRLGVERSSLYLSERPIEVEYDLPLQFQSGPDLVLHDLVDSYPALVFHLNIERNQEVVEKALTLSEEEVSPRYVDAIAYVEGKGWAVRKEYGHRWMVVPEDSLINFIKADRAFADEVNKSPGVNKSSVA